MVQNIWTLALFPAPIFYGRWSEMGHWEPRGHLCFHPSLTTIPYPPLWVAKNAFSLDTARTHFHQQHRAMPQGLLAPFCLGNSRLISEWCPQPWGNIRKSLFFHRLNAGHVGPSCSCLITHKSHLFTLVIFHNFGDLFLSFPSAFHLCCLCKGSYKV